MSSDSFFKGRGSRVNIHNRFEALNVELDIPWAELPEEERPSPRTKYFKDESRTVLTSNDSPDISFTYSVNPYRGCEHGCAYCYARPTHEYLGLSAGLDFETKIFVKENAPTLLREALMAKRWKPEPIIFSGVTDCYQPAERQFRLTRRCLEVLAEFKNPAMIITKNALVTRDIDVLKKLAGFNGVSVTLSVTTLNADLCSVLEPRTSRPAARLAAIKALADAGILVGVNVAPVIPALTDHEMPKILAAAREAGASFAGYTLVRLPHAVAPLFADWLATHFPERKDKVLHHLQNLRGGKLYRSDWGTRMRGEGAFAENLSQMFRVYCAKEGLNKNRESLSLRCDQFQRPLSAATKGQLSFNLVGETPIPSK